MYRDLVLGTSFLVRLTTTTTYSIVAGPVKGIINTQTNMSPSARPKMTKRTSIVFNGDHSTHDLYVEKDSNQFFGPYAHIRKTLDYSYHSNYKLQRQWVQDAIIDKLLREVVLGRGDNTGDSESNEPALNLTNHFGSLMMKDPQGQGSGESISSQSTFSSRVKDKVKGFRRSMSLSSCRNALDAAMSDRTSIHSSDNDDLTYTKPTHPWLVYVAGTKLSNRSATIKSLMQRRHTSSGSYSRPKLPLLGFVLVDRREIQGLLPEYSSYKNMHGEEEADNMTRSETGYIAEVLTRAALQAGMNVVSYSRMKEHAWHMKYFKSLLSTFDRLNIAVFHIVAPNEEKNPNTKDECLKIQKSIEQLKPCIHYNCKLQGLTTKERGVKLLTKGVTWKSFRSTFTQVPAEVRGTLEFGRQNDVSHRGDTGFIHQFDSDKSTEENHCASGMNFYGPYAHLRELLDYTYHKNYTRERQMLQDSIIYETLNRVRIVDKTGTVCTTPTEPFLVFTAGGMGAGKSYTLNKMNENGRFPLAAFVIVDPDEIRQIFPEYGLYVNQNPLKAGEMTRKEAGYIVEILTLAALQAGKNVLVDGSLRDAVWYSIYIEKLRETYPLLKIDILHVVAPKEAVFARAEVSSVP